MLSNENGLSEESFLNVFKKVFSGISIDSVRKNSYKLPPEREIASDLQNYYSRAEINYHMRRLRDSGVIESRRGDGNYLVDNISKAVTNSLETSLEQLKYLNYLSGNEIKETRRFFEMSVYEYWTFLPCDDQAIIISELQFRANQMKKLYTKYESELNIEKKEELIDSIIDKDIEFHKIIGEIANTNLLNIFINAISELQQNEIREFWLKSSNEKRSILINDHFDIVKALEKSQSLNKQYREQLSYTTILKKLKKPEHIENKDIEGLEALEKAKNDYHLAIANHYIDSY